MIGAASMADRVKPKTNEPIPSGYEVGQWTAEAYAHHEGGEWTQIGPTESTPKNYTMLRYRNGWIFDKTLLTLGLNPWRHIEDD